MTYRMIVDNFAGGGGASTGIEMALGRSPDIAINHDPVALAMHHANHPETLHLCTSVWKVDPDDIKGPIGLGWFSPDCKHFSKAKGGRPVEKGIRDLAWVVVRWAKRREGGPDVIMLENVEEFRTWGPIGADGKPDPERKGETFKQWQRELRRCGYKAIEWRELRACDFGAPTIRKRLFLIARRDGKPIVWPKPTHAPAAVNDDGVVTRWAKGHGLTLQDLQDARSHDTRQTLHYVDPPYVASTRSPANKYDLKHRMYRHEMTDADHVDLLAGLRDLQGMVILSGYAHPLYDNVLHDWRRIEREALADGARPRIEVLWINPACWEALNHERGGMLALMEA